MSDHALAQLNIARLRAPLDAPELAEFVAGLDPINALADRTPGFLWRLQTEEGDATALRPFGDDVIVNLSLWESLEALHGFVFRSDHAEFLRARRKWFERSHEPMAVLWWIPAGTLPEIADAQAALRRLRRNGPTPDAFTFRSPFSAPT